MSDAFRQHVPVRANILTHEVTDTDEVVLYDSQSRQLLVLNDFAAGVWELIDGQRTVDDLATTITDCVAADRQAVTSDVVAFLRQLEERKIVRWQGA